jgi:hypothetical protein
VKELPDPPALKAESDAHPSPAQVKAILEIGPMSPMSRYYIERDEERRIKSLLEVPGVTVTIQGHWLSGKSSMIARLHDWAIKNGRASCVIDFMGLEASELEDSNKLFLGIAHSVADLLGFDFDPNSDWNRKLSAKMALTRFLENEVLGRFKDVPVLLLFDNVGLVFSHPKISESFFATIRYWDGRRASDLDGARGWNRLGLTVALTLDPTESILTLDQSPFNVGLRVVLSDFDTAQVASLNQQYGQPLRGATEIDGLMKLVGGHPHLVRIALYTMATRQRTLESLRAEAIAEHGPFAGHLRHLLNVLANDPSLESAFRSILNGPALRDRTLFQKLWSVGLITGETIHNAAIRYKLYEDYFRTQLQ